ncbi:MAG: hypothetical protein HY040_01170 [Planctomycetes bacterium]|nr:hypothetical protein [Planctomycetota bacterium]
MSLLPDEIREAIADAIHPSNFYVGNGLELVWRPPTEATIPWEIFRGRVLDPAHTRQTRRFLEWNIYQKEGDGFSAEPILSVKWDRDGGEVHVVRAIFSYVWEGYDAGDNVIESRETTKWVRELVGTASVADPALSVAKLLGSAVRGTSRLPLTSLEAPLPAFSLGQLDYLGLARANRSEPYRSWREILEAHATPAGRILETVLRAVARQEIGELAERLSSAPPTAAEFVDMFLNVSLSPYTSFVANAIGLLRELTRRGSMSVDAHCGVLRKLLRLLNRHLTAYDLITFHHRGANYPDALLLDAALNAYLDLAERHSELFEEAAKENGADCRQRRTALRQACLLRRYYEGLLVPDAPTSPGENARVLPPPHVRVPEEQLSNVLKRTKRLYAGDPLPTKLGPAARRALRQSILDMLTSASWKEMGMAIFIDRPLGWDLPPGEPDQTPLFSHVAFSPAIARRRYKELMTLAAELKMDIDPATRRSLDQLFAGDLCVPGLTIEEVADPPKPCVSLADAKNVSADFVVLDPTKGFIRRIP